MRSRAPAITFSLLLTMSIGILAAGVWLARRTESRRIEREREPLRQFADSLSAEIQRLERHYEGHLRRIARDGKGSNEAGTRALCWEVVGVAQFSLVQPTTISRLDTHVAAELGHANSNPRPTFGRADSGISRHSVLLDESQVLRGVESSGWIEGTGRPTFYWVRSADSVVVLLIDRNEVSAAIDRWLSKWSRDAFATVRLAGGPDRFLGSEQQLLSTTEGSPSDPKRPDFLLPIRGQFGTWQIASWDRMESRTSYHAPTLAVSAALSAILVLLGVFLSQQQRRAFALAAQRVSFVNRVSHELRAPMTNILLNLDIVADAPDLPVGGAARLDLVREEANRLSRMIENVLTFSRGEEGKLQLRTTACRPDAVIDSVVSQFLAGFARRQITVRRQGAAAAGCQLDADALSQILSNVLSNVEKYAPGADCLVRSELTNERLIVSVSDTGPGIPAHAAARVFERFERLDSRVTEGVTGTGLGLSIARELAERMGGTLLLKPGERGATFELSIPAPRLEAFSAA